MTNFLTKALAVLLKDGHELSQLAARLSDSCTGRAVVAQKIANIRPSLTEMPAVYQWTVYLHSEQEVAEFDAVIRAIVDCANREEG